jgi:hypothetical protein
MPTITIDPGTITTPEEWLKAWQYAVFTLHLTAAKVTPPPTTPEEYDQLIEMINEELNSKYGGLIYYAKDMFPAISSNGGTALMAVQATDPSLVNTLSASPIDEIVTTGTGIGTVVATTATGSYSYVKRGVALATAISLLGATLFAAQLSQEDKEDLEFTVEPFTDDEGNVICYTDEEGTTYLPEDFIETLRQKLIEMGVYNTGNKEPSEAAGTITYSIDYGRTPQTGSFTNDVKTLYNNNIPYLALTDSVKVMTSSYGLRTVTHIKMNNVVYPVNEAIVFYTQNAIEFYFVLGDDVPLSSVASFEVYSDDVVLGGQSGVRIEDITITKDGVSKTVRTTNHASLRNANANTPALYGFTYGQYSNATLLDYQLAYAYLFSTGGGGVEGLTPDPNAVLPSDASRLMSDYFATWYDRKKVFKAIEQDDDGNITGFEDVNFLPAGFTDTNGLDEDTTQTQSEAQSGDPVIDPSKLDDLLPAIKEFFDNFFPTDPDTPSPTIPVEDSGDSPTPTPPLITGAGTDLIAIYNPTKAQIQAFNQFLWSLDPTQLVNWKKIFINPIEAVISLQMIYVTPITGETRNIKCGYIETDVPSKIVTNQYKDVDCGTVDLVEFYSNVWDYVDTQISIYLPFIGIVPLDTREVMGSILHVKYRVDVYTGTCLAQIIVTKQNSTAVLYTFPGNCSVQLPITSGQFSAMWGAMIGAIGIGIGGMVAGIPGAGAMADNYAANKLMSSNGVTIQRSGSIGSNAGVLGSRVPYLIITHPVPYDARDYNTQYGFPLNQTTRIGDVNGYTRIKDVHLSGIPCTDDELEQIERLLKDGVIIN